MMGSLDEGEEEREISTFEAVQLWGIILALFAGTIGLLLDAKAWSRFTEIPPNEPGPRVAYGLTLIGAATLAATLWIDEPLWLVLPAVLFLQHLALIRACRRHEARRARIVGQV
ncbi:hypothetical protein EON81_24215 [bacterium]|nr:MAG: hypothetical protein EON81_24215 [bacterium]